MRCGMAVAQFSNAASPGYAPADLLVPVSFNRNVRRMASATP
jgi:hypothetical protein